MDTTWGMLIMCIGGIHLLIIHGNNCTNEHVIELLPSVPAGYRTFLNTRDKKIILVSNFARTWTNAKQECEILGLSLKKTYIDTGNEDIFWVKDESCADNQCSSASTSGNACDNDCTTELKFFCRKKVWKLLQVHNGHLGFTFNNTWSPLCIDLSFNKTEIDEICNRTYIKFYELLSNPRHSVSTDYGEIEDCHFNKLQCPGEPPRMLPIATSCNSECIENETITLTCSAFGGIQRPVIILATHGTDLTTTDSWTYTKNRTIPYWERVLFSGSVNLTLSHDDDNKKFTCRVIYKNDTIGQQNYTLRVLYRPIVDVRNSVVVNEADEVVIPCHVTSNPSSNVTWSGPNGNEITTGTNLTFTMIGRAAIGYYTCRAENRIGFHSVTSYLYINAPPKMYLYLHGFTDQNQTVTMRCAGTGIPTPNISWSQDSDPITDSAQYSTIFTVNRANQYLVYSTLTVSGVGHGDVLGYTCNIENKNGNIKKTFRIRRRLKCRCRSRNLKNCVPVNYTNSELQQQMENTKEELKMKAPTQQRMKKVSASDNRASAKFIGVLGFIVVVSVPIIIIGLDLHQYFYQIKKKLNRKSKKKNQNKKRNPQRQTNV